MTLSVPILAELARAYGVDLPAEMLAAVGRIEAAERGDAGDVTPVTAVTRRRLSKGALRTRAWRARKAGIAGQNGTIGAVAGVTEASPKASPSVTEASPVTSRVTLGDAIQQKENSPTPPIRKTTPPQKAPPNWRKRHRVTSQASPVTATPTQLFLERHDARFREVEIIRGRSLPDHGGGWWVDLDLVAEAEKRIAAKVTRLRPAISSSTAAIIVATGPPLALRSG